ncbi:hypothetical protein ARMSODRAFT_162261 [Armillaria solidipes]|uniref:Uncharacterized protein n=1 Tax=Armillaria solidipes TaxID=1076256 RepID=A0A2H3BTQ8_9AGAR|nr:hypothetical protein ARMSODRAFT_162261 [Armillaria solidipes]
MEMPHRNLSCLSCFGIPVALVHSVRAREPKASYLWIARAMANTSSFCSRHHRGIERYLDSKPSRPCRMAVGPIIDVSKAGLTFGDLYAEGFVGKNDNTWLERQKHKGQTS